MAGSLHPRATMTRRLWAWVTENSPSTSIPRVASGPPAEAVPSSMPKSHQPNGTHYTRGEGIKNHGDRQWQAETSTPPPPARSSPQGTTGSLRLTVENPVISWPALHTTHHTLVP